MCGGGGGGVVSMYEVLMNQYLRDAENGLPNVWSELRPIQCKGKRRLFFKRL